MLNFKYFQFFKRTFCLSFQLVVYGFMLLGFHSSAQTLRQSQEITNSYNKQYLHNLADQSGKKSLLEKTKAENYAMARNIPLSYTSKDGAFVELQRILPDGTLLYYQTNNADAAISTRINFLNTGGDTGYNLDGQNMIAYVWDGGHPRVSHQEYDGPGGNNRVSIMDAGDEGGVQLHFHAAHVTGTICDSGVVPQAKGMAPQSIVRAYMWNNDLSEATLAAANGMLLSNHSYGFKASTLPDQWFGAYQIDAQEWDDVMFNAPYYLMVNSAGNDGNDNTSNASPLAFGYDKLNGISTAKNNLVIAAGDDAVVDSNGSLISVNIASLSSQGPTDDFRIKPDITGNGVEVFSTYASSDSDYESISGTSMASPNITGSLLLLQEHYNNVNGNFMRAATLKGLALHTADDVGLEGPDAIWGWGLMNSKKAAETIALDGYGPIIQELQIAQGQTITYNVNSDGLNDLKASISWTDPAGVINYDLNSPIAALVNDLDIRIENTGTTYYPWRLTSVTSNSNNGDNTKDPFERVDVQNASGSYTITITHKGTLVGGSQAFSLIVTGVEITCIAVTIPENVRVDQISSSSAKTLWNLVPGALYDLRYRKIADSGWMEILDITENNYLLTGLTPNTDYEFQVRSKCTEGELSSYSNLVNFSTTAPIYCDSYSNISDPDFHISNVKLNTIDNTSTESTYSDFTNISTELVAGQSYIISITTTADSPWYDTSYSVWIDYNADGQFEDSEEKVFSLVTDSGTIASGSFTVPMNITSLVTTMRISLNNSETPAGPCDSFIYGEVEDYTIQLTVPQTNFVYENGTWTPTNPAGVCTAIDNIHIINGETIFTTDISVNNIDIDSEATLNVEKVLTIAGDINNAGNLVFSSTAFGNGELGPVPLGSTISGDVTVERYMKNKRSYRMVSSSVNTTSSIHYNWQEGATSNIDNPALGYGTHITGSTIDQSNGFDGTFTGNPSMFTVDVANQQFQAVSNTNLNTLMAGNPYLLFVRGDRSIDLTDPSDNASSETTLRATGSLVMGTINQNFPSAIDQNFVMFGNPFQSTVDITSVLSDPNSVNLYPEFYYIYDSSLGDNGAYVTVNLQDGDGTNTANSNANKYLQPGQAAQIKVSGAAVVSFNESHKSPGNFTSTNRTPISGSNMLTFQLYTTENFMNDEALHDSFGIIFSEDNDNELTPKDAIKPMNFYENLGVNLNDTYLSLEQRKMPVIGEVYSILSSGYKHSNYTFKIEMKGLENNYLYLYDNFTGTSELLAKGENIYNFAVVKSDSLSIAADRFSIHVSKLLNTNDYNLLSDIRLFPNPLNSDIFYISAPSLNGEELFVNISDLTGRIIFEETIKCRSNIITVPLKTNVASGVYLVTLNKGEYTQTLRLIRK